MPFFSIVIPTYNRANLIEKTIRSVLSQDFVDFEIIVVDDGSTDATQAVVQEINDPRIRYIYQENGERGKARNTGVINASGSYIFFLDSDDLIYPDHLSHAFKNLESLEFPVFFHSRYELLEGNRSGKSTRLIKKNLLPKVQEQNQFACQFYLRKSEALLFPFSENRELKIGEDWEVILKIAQRYPLHFSNHVTAAIVVHGNRTMELASEKDILRSRDILVENLKNDSLISIKVQENVWVELTTLAALSAAIARNKKTAWSLWLKGIKKRPRHILKRRTFAIFKKIIVEWRN